MMLSSIVYWYLACPLLWCDCWSFLLIFKQIVFYFYWKKEKLEEIEKRKHWIVLQVYLMNVFCKDVKNLDIISQISIFVSEAVKVWVA